jgi:hypothetical protein
MPEADQLPGSMEELAYLVIRIAVQRSQGHHLSIAIRQGPESAVEMETHLGPEGELLGIDHTDISRRQVGRMPHHPRHGSTPACLAIELLAADVARDALGPADEGLRSTQPGEPGEDNEQAGLDEVLGKFPVVAEPTDGALDQRA